jgi:hypothetical protein
MNSDLKMKEIRYLKLLSMLSSPTEEQDARMKKAKTPREMLTST